MPKVGYKIIRYKKTEIQFNTKLGFFLNVKLENNSGNKKVDLTNIKFLLLEQFLILVVLREGRINMAVIRTLGFKINFYSFFTLATFYRARR